MESLLEPIYNRLRLLVGRCIITATKYNKGDLEADVELIAGEKRRNIEFLQQYGFSSRPKGNVSALAVFVGGNRDNGAVIATNGDDFAANLEPGEVLVHSPHGQKILLKNDGSIEMEAASGKSIVCKNKIECPEIDCSGDVSAQNVSAKVEVSGNMGLIHLTKHTHVCSSPGSPSATPLG